MKNALFLLLLVPAHAFAQSPPKVDFGREVQPLLEEHCISCHGPSQQMNGFRAPDDLPRGCAAGNEGARRAGRPESQGTQGQEGETPVSRGVGRRSGAKDASLSCTTDYPAPSQ